jgi:hypothetical protein
MGHRGLCVSSESLGYLQLPTLLILQLQQAGVAQQLVQGRGLRRQGAV